MYNNIIKRSQDRLIKRSIYKSKIYLSTHTKCPSCNNKKQVYDTVKQLQKENLA
jgi:transcription elongation factor Elf1